MHKPPPVVWTLALAVLCAMLAVGPPASAATPPTSWTVQYEGGVNPTADGWSTLSGCCGTTSLVDLGGGNSAWHIVDNSSTRTAYQRTLPTVTALTILTRVKFVASSAANNVLVCGFYANDAKRLQIYWHDGSFGVGLGTGTFTQGMPANEYHTLRVTADIGTGTWQMYIDDCPGAIGSGTLADGTGSLIYWGAAGSPFSLTGELEVDYFYYLVDAGYAPSCCVGYSPAVPQINDLVTFTATVNETDYGAPVSLAWDFGDGGSATVNPTTHAYTSANTYAVTLTVTYSEITGTCSTSVRVNAPPTCSFTGPTSGYTGIEYCFTSTGTDPDGEIVSYSWLFGDQTPDPPAGTVLNASFEDASAWTVYGAKLPDTDGYCGLAPRTASAYLGQAVNGGQFNDIGAYQTVSGLLPGGNYRAGVWIMTSSGTGGNPDAVKCRIGVDPTGGTDRAAGSVIWSTDTSNDGCPPGSYVQITVDFVEDAGGTATIFVEFDGNNDTGDYWNIVATDDVSLVGTGGSGAGSPACHIYQTGGTYTVELTVTDNDGASATCSQSITIEEVLRPECAITYSPAEPSVESDITFNANATHPDALRTVVGWDWDFGDGDTATGDPANHRYDANGTYTVTCTVTDDAPAPGPWTGSCVTEVTVTSPPVCVITGPDTVPAWSVQCYDGTSSYDPDNCGGVFPCPGEGIVSYAWDFGVVGGTSLVRNGDFEGGWIDGVTGRIAEYWTGDVAAGADILWDKWSILMPGPLNEYGPHGGSETQLAWFSGDTSGSVDVRLYQVVSGLTPGHVYQVSGWIAMDDPGVSDHEIQIGYDPNGGTDFTWLSALPADGYWHQGVIDVVAASSSITIAYRWRSTAVPDSGTYYCYADDASVLEAPTGPTACHIFTEQGVTTIGLTVTDDEGLDSTCTKAVTVGPPASQQPTCSFTVSTPTYTQVAITFDASASTDPDGTVTGYDWDFGDGTTATGNPATHTYPAGSAGSYIVTLMVTDNSNTVNVCTQTVSVTNPAPTCSFTLPGGTPQPGQEVCFDGTGSSDANGTIASYLWDFGVPADLTSLLLTNPSFETGDFSGWTLKGTQNEVVLTSATPLCTGLIAPDGVGYFAYDNWDAGGLNIWGQILQTSSTASITLVPGETYKVDAYVVATSGCTEDPIARVGVDPQGGTNYLSPNVQWSGSISATGCAWYEDGSTPESPDKVGVIFTAETSRATVFLFYRHNNIYEGCGGSVAAFDDVKFYKQPSSTEPAPCYAFDAAGDYTITLTVTDDEGSSSTCEQVLTVSGTTIGEPPDCGEPPISMSSDPSPPVKGTEITFTSNAYDPDGTITSYQWNFGDGNTATGNPVTHAYDAPGSYAARCVVTDDASPTPNSTTCSVGVDVANAPPVCCISGPDYAVVGEEVCFDSCSTDIDGTIESYLWTLGEGNLVVNGDFESGFQGSGVAIGWTDWKDPWGDPVTYRAENTNQHGGTACQALDFTEMSGGMYQVVNGTEPGKQYLFTAWLRYDTNDAGGPPWYELGWDLDGGTEVPPDPPEGSWVQFQPAITGLPYGSWYSNHNDDVDPGPPYKSRVLAATGTKISVWVKYGNIYDSTPRTGYVDDVSLLEFETTASVCHTYLTPGDYTVELTVTDDKGASATCSRTVTVLPSAPPICSFTISPEYGTMNQTITFDGSGSSDPDGSIVSWEWDFGDGGSDAGEIVTHAYGAGGTYTVTLTVTDDTDLTATCTDTIDIAETVQVDIPLSQGWHMMSLPLEPVNKTVLVDRTTKVEDPDSIFYSAYAQGNDPRNRLFRMEPAVGYWVYNPDLYPTESWYEVDVEPPVGKPHPGPWWQGFWFYVEPTEGVTVSYTAYPMPAGSMVRFLDINKNYTPGTFSWAWMMVGASARMPSPYSADVTTWPLTSTVNDTMWGQSTPPAEPATWLPTSTCAAADGWDQGLIGLPLVGYTPGVGYYTVSPPSGDPYCGAPADYQTLWPGEGYWLDVEEPDVWLSLMANQWP